MKDTLVLIPTYNEEKTIGKLLENLLSRQTSEIADIMVINDKSVDDTAKVVSSFGDKVILVNHIYNMGYGAALKTGYLYAVKNNYDYVISWMLMDNILKIILKHFMKKFGRKMRRISLSVLDSLKAVYRFRFLY